MDTLATVEVRGLKAEKRVVSKVFSGSDRDVQCRFMDAIMSLVARYGRPDYFVTMTCNPYCPETHFDSNTMLKLVPLSKATATPCTVLECHS